MMGKVTGFKEFDRKTEDYRPVELRLKDYGEIFTGTHNIGHLQEQGARCMDCGVPFCQSEKGCPVDNLIPEWNDLVYHGQWQAALIRLHKTNNFPDFPIINHYLNIKVYNYAINSSCLSIIMTV
jgi:glutamate synthase (NADPH/NADH) small chain